MKKCWWGEVFYAVQTGLYDGYWVILGDKAPGWVGATPLSPFCACPGMS